MFYRTTVKKGQILTQNTTHGAGFLQITQKYFFFVEHFCGLMFRFFWVNENGAIKICSSISNPYFFNSWGGGTEKLSYNNFSLE